MTRKDYEAIASALWVEAQLGGEASTLAGVASRLAQHFEEENSRFDSDRFLAACGLVKAN